MAGSAGVRSCCERLGLIGVVAVAAEATGRCPVPVDAFRFVPGDGDTSLIGCGYYMGETGYRESDIPGTTSNKTGYNFMQYVNGSNQWVTQPCGLTEINDTPTRWTKETISCSHRRIWTFNP